MPARQHDPDKARKAIAAMMRMKNPDIEALRRRTGFPSPVRR